MSTNLSTNPENVNKLVNKRRFNLLLISLTGWVAVADLLQVVLVADGYLTEENGSADVSLESFPQIKIGS
jgi:hypothetical protein